MILFQIQLRIIQSDKYDSSFSSITFSISDAAPDPRQLVYVRDLRESGLEPDARAVSITTVVT